MEIVSKETGFGFSFNGNEAVIVANILTPVLCDFAPSERIGALALQIACACWEEQGTQHPALDNVTAQLMGAVVEELVKRGFKAQRELDAESDESDDGEGEEAVQ